ncbi:hypothetical protein PaecuDRAFT_4675 [Paenibacillus curdlanolyticus YK9]|uniref:Uncharacterized protein n=1 Tax=Paenibacillus curdlanolyticus YK9 TaxID=717606 RepID=E0IG84_9BACL|nr:hypothetical protein [Paenibacillus curdlanolyticus]EFM08486.1 hypothetical protein PaecuDRAFT_4675 [Paenibacillus curdlanolyticus YK9]
MVTLGLSVNVSNDCDNLSLDHFGNEICIHQDNGLICVNTCSTSNPSLPFTLQSVGIQMDDVNVIALSYTGQAWMITESLVKKVRKRLGLKDSQQVVVVPSQELSYAYTSHFTSGLDSSLLIVTGKSDEDSAHPKISYYAADRNDVRLIDQDFTDADCISFNDVYRQLAQYLHLKDELEIQKLALYGKDKHKAAGNLWALDNECRIISGSGPSNPQSGSFDLMQLLASAGVDVPNERQPEEPLSEEHAELAQYVQNQVETIFMRKVNCLLEKQSVSNVCITGDLTENHLLLNQMGATLSQKLYVPPVDYCQNLSIGNTIYALLHNGEEKVLLNELKLNFQMENIYRTYLCCCS